MQCYRIVNGIKNKNIKNSLGATWNASHLAEGLCALRHWKRVPMPPTTQSLRHPLTRAFHFAPRIKTARLMIKWFLGRRSHQISQNNFAWLGCDTSRSHQMVDTRFVITIMGGREVSRPYWVWFFAEGERFLSFWRCHRPRWGGRRWCCGVADSSFGLKSDMPQH